MLSCSLPFALNTSLWLLQCSLFDKASASTKSQASIGYEPCALALFSSIRTPSRTQEAVVEGQDRFWNKLCPHFISSWLLLITLSTFVDFGIPCAPIASISRLGLFGTSTNPSVQSASPRAAPFVRNRTKFISDCSEQLWFHKNPDAYRSPSAWPFHLQINTLVEPIVLSNYVFRSSKSVQPLLRYRQFRFLHSAESVSRSQHDLMRWWDWSKPKTSDSCTSAESSTHCERTQQIYINAI